MGLFACNGLAAGEVVWAERAQAGSQISAVPRSHAWIEALPPASRKAYCHFMYKTGEDEYQSLAEFNDMPIADFPSVRTVDVSNYMNHSCAPTCWFVDGGDEYTGLMVAARDLLPGDEITYDYCTSEDCELSPEWQCLCGAASCRKRVTPQDWQLPEMQAKYASHFLPHIAAKIAKATGTTEQPLQPVDPSTSWWLRELEGRDAPTACADRSAVPLAAKEGNGAGTATAGSSSSSSGGSAAARADGAPPARKEQKTACSSMTPRERHRAAHMRARASGRDLDTLNRQAAMLIVHHGLKVCQNDQVGGYVRAGAHITKGDLVMLLPPNLLIWEDDVDDFNKCLQIGVNGSGERLFSSSITPHDIDNYLCHSCEPNCHFIIGSDLACGLIASRDISAGESINFDYDTTEDDLRGDRGGFECHCGVPSCRKFILGKLYSPPPGGPPDGAPLPEGVPPPAPAEEPPDRS